MVTITGNGTDETLKAPTGDGADYKYEGKGGNDAILASNGDDVLLGGAGSDVLFGGAVRIRSFLTSLPKAATSTSSPTSISVRISWW